MCSTPCLARASPLRGPPRPDVSGGGAAPFLAQTHPLQSGEVSNLLIAAAAAGAPRSSAPWARSPHSSVIASWLSVEMLDTSVPCCLPS